MLTSVHCAFPFKFWFSSFPVWWSTFYCVPNILAIMLEEYGFYVNLLFCQAFTRFSMWILGLWNFQSISHVIFFSVLSGLPLVLLVASWWGRCSFPRSRWSNTFWWQERYLRPVEKVVKWGLRGLFSLLGTCYWWI